MCKMWRNDNEWCLQRPVLEVHVWDHHQLELRERAHMLTSSLRKALMCWQLEYSEPPLPSPTLLFLFTLLCT